MGGQKSSDRAAVSAGAAQCRLLQSNRKESRERAAREYEDYGY